MPGIARNCPKTAKNGRQMATNFSPLIGASRSTFAPGSIPRSERRPQNAAPSMKNHPRTGKSRFSSRSLNHAETVEKVSPICRPFVARSPFIWVHFGAFRDILSHFFKPQKKGLKSPQSLYLQHQEKEYRRWESNPYFRGNAILNRARLPIPPHRLLLLERGRSLHFSHGAVKLVELRNLLKSHNRDFSFHTLRFDLLESEKECLSSLDRNCPYSGLPTAVDGLRSDHRHIKTHVLVGL